MSRTIPRLAAAGVLAVALAAPFTPLLSGAVAAGRDGGSTHGTGLRDVPAHPGLKAAQTIDVTSSNVDEVKAMAKTTPVVFLVTAPSWCSACQDLDPKIRQIASSTDGWILAIVDQDKAGGADQQFNVSGFPTMVPWGASGEMSNPARHVGSGDASEIQSWIDSVRSGYGPGPAPAPTTTTTTTAPAPAPTDTPAPEPTTDVPTVNPTVSPTVEPTVNPTNGPLPIPTNLPTDIPTGLPTGIPTALPTGLPGGLPLDPAMIAQIIQILSGLGIFGSTDMSSVDWSSVDLNALQHMSPDQARATLKMHHVQR